MRRRRAPPRPAGPRPARRRSGAAVPRPATPACRRSCRSRCRRCRRPWRSCRPRTTNHSTILPVFIDRPHLGIVTRWIRAASSVSSGIQSTAVLTAPAIFAASGMNRSSSASANGTGVCGPVTSWIGARSDPNASCATVAAMSVASEQRGLASSTTTRRPVFSTDSRIVSMSSGLVVRGSITSACTPDARELGGRLHRGVHHPPDGDDRDVAALAHDVGLAERDRVALLRHVAGGVVEHLVLGEDHRVVVADGRDQQALGVVRVRRRRRPSGPGCG